MLFKRKAWAIVTVVTGAILEYYSYMLLASMISKPEFLGLFFAPGDDSTQLLKGTLFFFIAALCRPLGALIFGWIGDKYGRRQALFSALLTMACSCFVIAALPVYQKIGTLALATLFIARVAQIMSASGETNGAPIFLIEHFGIMRSCFASGLAYFGTMIGSTLASYASAQFTGGLWRYAFLIGGLAGFVGILIRLRVKESKEFTQSTQTAEETDMIQQSLASYLIVGIISAACSGGFYFVYVGIPTVCRVVCQHKYTLASYTTYGTLLYSTVLLITGYIADYISLFKVMRSGAIAFVLSCVALLYSMTYAPAAAGLHMLFYFALVFSLGVFAAPSHSFMYRFFPPRCRYRAVSISYSIATATAGSGTPWIVQNLTKSFNSPLASAIWIVPILTLAYITLFKAQKIWIQRELDSVE